MKWMKNIGIFALGMLIVLVVTILCIPVNALFEESYSTIIEDRNGHLLDAQIASDEQWRFPPLDTIPKTFSKAVIEFEDKRFYHHIGIDFKAILRAIVNNSKKEHARSGASTISMQLARMSRNKGQRTIFQKLIEMAIALKIEIRYSKDEILALWASHAPFGGNIVGLEAASWRYYHKEPA
jgi:penicillin-binding protein 1C